MKTIHKLIIVIAVVLGVQTSYASNPLPTVSIKVLDANNFAIYMMQIEGQKVQVSLKDKLGQVLYSKNLKGKSSFTRKMNLKELPVGQYSLEVSDNIGTISYPIALSSQTLEIPVEAKQITFNPIIRKSENTVSLVLFSPSAQSHELSIYNDQNELIHDEKIEETVNYQRQFDFSEAIPGSYSIVINSQGHEYTYHMPVR